MNWHTNLGTTFEKLSACFRLYCHYYAWRIEEIKNHQSALLLSSNTTLHNKSNAVENIHLLKFRWFWGLEIQKCLELWHDVKTSCFIRRGSLERGQTCTKIKGYLSLFLRNILLIIPLNLDFWSSRSTKTQYTHRNVGYFAINNH